MINRLIDSPDLIRVCDGCGLIVLVFTFPDGSPLVWDPDLVQRRMVRSRYPRDLVDRHGFGVLFGGTHACPPPRRRPVTLREQIRRMLARLDAWDAEIAGEGPWN